jgi:hypothetical protein
MRFSELLGKVLNQSTDSVTVERFDKDYKLYSRAVPTDEAPFSDQGHRPMLEESLRGKPQDSSLYGEQKPGGLAYAPISSNSR